MGNSHHSHGVLLEAAERFAQSLPIDPHIAEFIAHFAVDFAIIMLLFFAVTIAVSYFSSFPALLKVREKIKSSRGLPGYIVAAAAGILSPLCSCTIIPVFAGLLAFGVPTGYLFVFLTSASMLNLSVLISLFVWADRMFFIIYIICAAAVSLLSGILPWISRLDCAGGEIEVCGCSCSCGHHHEHEHKINGGHTDENTHKNGRFSHCLKDTVHMLKEVFPWILMSVLLSSLLTHLTPDLLPQLSRQGGIAAVATAAVIGVLVHPDIFSVLPFLHIFAAISPQCGFIFLLFAMCFSIPGTLLLLKVIKPRAVVKYSVTVLGAAAVFAAVAVRFVG